MFGSFARGGISLLVAATMLMAGCSGDDGAAADDAVGPPGGDGGFEGDGGTVQGVVLDTELAPIEGSAVIIRDVAETMTDAAGAFTLNNVEPGTHDVFAQALGYDSAARKVTVEAGQTAKVQFELDALAVDEAFSTTEILEGHICFQTNTGGLIVNYGNVACGGQGSIFVDFVVDKGLRTIVAQMQWEPTSALTAPVLDLRIWQGGARSGVFSCDHCYGGTVGASPIYLRIDDKFEGVNGDDAEDSSTLTNTIYVPPDDSMPGGLNIVFDQRATIYDTMFYGAEAPQGFSALPDA